MKANFVKFIYLSVLVWSIVLYFDRCSNLSKNLDFSTKNITYKSDTVFAEPGKIDFDLKIPKPQIVYIDTNSRVITKDTFQKKVNEYTDSISDKNLTLYYSSLVDGELIKNNLSYSLKVPLTITNTITKTNVSNGFYITGTIGGNKNQFSNVTLGAMYVNRKRNSFHYNYNLIQKTHNFGTGIKIWGK